MKAVIPAKASSTRVPDKNFRPFHGDRSLFDLTVEKLLRHLPAEDITMSCEDPARADAARRWGINFHLREPRYVDNYTPQPEVVRAVCDAVEGDDDILWCQLVDPLFDSHGECIERWRTLDASHDSLVVVYPRRYFLLDEHYRPEGFGFGHWHIPSQELPVRYQLPFTLMILRRDVIRRIGYYIGARPYWFHATNHTVDIDTEDDFEMAQAVYAYLMERRSARSAR